MIHARFTKDMAETLLRFFETYATDGVVTVEVDDLRLWLVHPHNKTRQFLGQADLSEQQLRRLEQRLRRLN